MDNINTLVPTDRDIVEQQVINTCLAWGLTHLQAFYIFSQGIQESGFNSHVYIANFGNFAGMKMPHSRHSPYIVGRGTQAPVNESFVGDPYNYYAKYESLTDAVKDLLDRHRCFGINWAKITTPQYYIEFCHHTHYFQGSLSIYESNVAALVKKYNIV